jgi:small-conductance mechanosensitive channel
VNWFWHYEAEIIGTAAALLAGWLLSLLGKPLSNLYKGSKQRYRTRKFVNTMVVLLVFAALVILWSQPLKRTGTFLGIIGAGLAIALKEPLLSIAGRLAIFAGNMYSVGDRIEINKLSGDVIDVGVFYTRMMEIGNWVGGDQASGRIVQFPNASIFGAPVFNYTQNFSYIWDEIKLPVTYSSNLEAVSKILLEVGDKYTREFLQKAEAALENMRHSFLVPAVELKPAVYFKVTDNWVELTLRYVVDPKKRRNARTFIFREAFHRIQERDHIQIGSSTMNVTLVGEQAGQKSGRDRAGAFEKPERNEAA